MGAVPVDVPPGVRAGGGHRWRGTRGDQIEVEGAAAGAAAGLEGLPEAEGLGVLQNGAMGGGVVGVGDDGTWMAAAELIQPRLEQGVEGGAAAVLGGGAREVVPVVSSRDEGQREGEAAGERMPLHDHVLGAFLEEGLSPVKEDENGLYHGYRKDL